ncbi:hypothetical protein [Terriglobus tenax]|uniref:hypothetical protein n=1 Tax=Terriglobus tenax TaxID=1111115 RepID=UPI0021E08452|nr:hypothetical protein [Terriglobus tenax]
MALLLEGCFGHNAPTREAFSLDAAARTYIRLAVALGEHDPDSIDYYVGPADWVADIRKQAPSTSQIHRDATALITSLTHLPADAEPAVTRKDFLLRQLHAIACRSAYLAGAHSTFDQEIACSFETKIPEHLEEQTLASVRSRLNELLPGKGPLAARYNAFEAQYAVPVTKLRPTVERAIAGCRQQTQKHVTLPADESIALELTGDKPWVGFSRYQGKHHSQISINADYPVTINSLLDLACHETYPGHHLFNMTVDDSLVQAAHRVEFSVQPSYSPQSFLSEGAATLAGEVAFRDEQRLRFEREELCPLAGLKCKDLERHIQVEELMHQLEPAIPVIVRGYMNGEMEFVRTGEALEKQVLMDHYFETLKYLNEFRSYVVTYTIAPGLLRKALPQGEAPADDERRWKVYRNWAQQQPSTYPWVQ